MRASELPPDSKYDELRPLGKPLPEIGRLSELLRGKVGLIFTDEAIFDLKPRIEANKVAAAAKVGVIVWYSLFLIFVLFSFLYFMRK